MRRPVILSLLVLLALSSPLVLDAASLRETRPTARAWLVLDDLTGTSLRFNRTKEFRPIASTTKLLTALVVAEAGGLGKRVRISANAAGQQPSKMGLRAGELWSRRDLLHALLMQSANDAATALAEGLSGTETAFCRRLTERARKMGCGSTRIRRASGLPAAGQGSTARDLARIADRALSNAVLKKILDTAEVTIRSSTGRAVRIVNKNRMHDDVDEVLGKTGYTRRAQRCFAGQVVLGGRRHTIVLLGSKNLWGDLKILRTWTKNFVAALEHNRRHLSRSGVKSWQSRLSKAGHDPGPVDGVWGAKTQMAYLRWEQARSKSPDGRVD